MCIFSNFINILISYGQELWLALLIGFLISGIFNEFIPTDIIQKYLGQKGVKPILLSSLVGTLLPVCCFGSLPIAVTMQKKGAKLGPTLAFLVATPATSVSALIVCWKLLGSFFTFYIFGSAILLGLIMGLIGNKLKFTMAQNLESSHHHEEEGECCHTQCEECKKAAALSRRIKNVLKYALITLPKEIGLELILGVIVASLIVSVDPIQSMIRAYLSGGLAYIFTLAFGLATYVCSTASVPMADAFTRSGMGLGPVMVYLLIGPITSYGMIFVLRKKFGAKVLGAYLLTICMGSIILGFVFERLAGY